MNELIADAILTKTCLTVLYNDKERVVEPHTLGKDLLRVWQSNPDEGWKLMRIDRIQRVTQIGGVNFDGPRPGYRRGDTAMRDIVEQL